MTLSSDVEAFLGQFRSKLEVFDVIFLNRDKNLQALIDLEITRLSRKETLRELKVSDYYRGPTRDTDGGADIWEFGTSVKQKEVYIKITIGIKNKPVICISFHLAERPIQYPFKERP
jgi:hypothetical protein